MPHDPVMVGIYTCWLCLCRRVWCVKGVDVERWGRYFVARDGGLGVVAAARRARLSVSSAYRFERGDQSSGGLEAAVVLGVHTVAGVLVDAPLCVEARRALEDFTFFRLRYFGRVSSPWQERAAYEVLRRLGGSGRDFVVMNEPPGSGKSTLFTHDIPCWLIVRDRTVRIQLGSRTERQARMYAGRIKKSLERDAPLRANADALASGRAFDALATLQDDFGAFRPEGRSDVWRAESLTVRQLDGIALDDKEPTVSAWGQDSGFLGGRFDVVVWDDLVDRKNTKTVESKESIREWWDSEAETRLEPGGVLLLQGQRIANNDLYRYCLDKKNVDESTKYSHVVFKAHDVDRCTGAHGVEARPWPDGCLLDPYRLPWKMLEQIKFQNPRGFALLYQQEEGSDVGGLVDPAWIDGGLDVEGYFAPGCKDPDRMLGEVPYHLVNGNGWSFLTVDPSPTEWWGVIWWIYDPDTDRRYVIDLWRRRMNPEDFISLDLNTFEWSGLIPEVYATANDLGVPVTHVIVEVNAAQRWLLSQPHVQRWMEQTDMVFVPHTTSVNKRDPKFGFESIGDLFRQGMIRLPYGNPAARLQMGYMVQEALTYPDGDTDDILMSTWFQKLAVENHYTPRQMGLYRLRTPSWLSTARRGIA
jgi:hypothetical protein